MDKIGDDLNNTELSKNFKWVFDEFRKMWKQRGRTIRQ